MGRGRPVAVAVLGLRARVWARPPGLRSRLTRYARQCAPLSRRLPPSAPPSRALASARRRSGLRWALPVGCASVRPAPPVGRAAAPVARGPCRPLPAGAPFALRRSGCPGASGRVPCPALPCGLLRASVGRPCASPGAAFAPGGPGASLAGRSSLRPGPLRRPAAALRALPSLLPRGRCAGLRPALFRAAPARLWGWGVPPAAAGGVPGSPSLLNTSNGPVPASPHSPPIQQNGYIFC